MIRTCSICGADGAPIWYEFSPDRLCLHCDKVLTTPEWAAWKDGKPLDKEALAAKSILQRLAS